MPSYLRWRSPLLRELLRQHSPPSSIEPSTFSMHDHVGCPPRRLDQTLDQQMALPVLLHRRSVQVPDPASWILSRPALVTSKFPTGRYFLAEGFCGFSRLVPVSFPSLSDSSSADFRPFPVNPVRPADEPVPSAVIASSWFLLFPPPPIPAGSGAPDLAEPPGPAAASP